VPAEVLSAGLFRARTTFNGVESSLEKDSTRLAGGGLGDDEDELTLLLLVLLAGKGEKLPGALAGPLAGCIFAALEWMFGWGLSHLGSELCL
jgi:hypothetical protein